MLSSSNPMPVVHDWRFFRAGGFDQVSLERGADLLALAQLDQKLWVALSCPTCGIEFDARTLEMIDDDHDGHIRAAEIIAAVQWAGARLKDADLLVQGLDRLPLSAINDDADEGRDLLAAARHILLSLAKPNETAISVDDMADMHKLIAAMRFNGDGIIPPQAVEDAELKALVEEIISCYEPVYDLGGEQGISAELMEQFFAQAEAYASWWQRAENDTDIWFAGEKTVAAADAFRAIQGKVEDYFTRCRLAAYDPRAALPLSRSVEDYQLLASQQLDANAAGVAEFPLAVIGADKPLPLHAGINPAWIGALNNLRDKVVVPLLGNRNELSAEEWGELCSKFVALENWLGDKPENGIEQLGIARIRTILESSGKADIEDLIARDKALEAEVNATASVDRLVHYCRDLHTLANNFVSFRNFYTGAGKAVFQAGTLYLDGRSCELCVRVENVSKHATLANLSRACLVYCECIRKGGSEKMFIAAAFTAGDSDQLMAGRNGVFYDRKGQDWDATIVRILEHPISVRQAFWMPYKRAAKMLSEQIQKFAAARSESAQAKMVKVAVESVAKPGEAKPPAAPFDVAKFAGIFAAIGLAVGALGTAIASMMGGILELAWWQIPLLLLCLILFISGASMFLAWLKLKQRSLAPILDANGWAVNARAKINIPFGTALTGIARLPQGAERSLADPYAEQKPVWPYVVLLGLLIAAAWLMLGMNP